MFKDMEHYFFKYFSGIYIFSLGPMYSIITTLIIRNVVLWMFNSWRMYWEIRLYASVFNLTLIQNVNENWIYIESFKLTTLICINIYVNV